MSDSSLLIHTNEVLLKDNDRWLHFADPCRIFLAQTLEEVLPALREIEQLLEQNDWHAAGFLSYEAAPAFDAALQTKQTPGFPYLWFGLYPQPRVVELPLSKRYHKALNWKPTVNRAAYNSAIQTIKEYIGQGQTYQVNYTMRLQAHFKDDAWDLFLGLAKSQNKQAAYLDLGRYVICSASPELFFQLDGETIICRPMKGTAQRGRTTLEDRERAEWLRTSQKNRAENVMIVDMIRNDLGRIAKTGSVRVTQLFETERYPTLWQMTSTVTAETSHSLTDIFAGLVPCASITGAPKVSTMRIIAQLENTPRKVYTGSIGYISPGRNAKFNVAIRTVLIDRERQEAEYGTGGGVVWDSTSTDEYEEALLKARVLDHPPHRFSLLETMLWTPNGGFLLGDKHLARMLDSASYFAIPVTKEKLEEYFNQLSSSFSAPQRVRVRLDQTGNLDFEVRPFHPAEHSETLKACLAKAPVNSQDVFLFHKTTQRAVYESARKGTEEYDDVLLYNESRELTEFTIGNLVVSLDGQLLTPPIACGVLPGTFRAHLLETGQVLERSISMERLNDCAAIYRVNSVRKWQQVEIDEKSGKLQP